MKTPGIGLRDEIEFLEGNWDSCRSKRAYDYLGDIAVRFQVNQFIKNLRLTFRDAKAAREFRAKFVFRGYRSVGNVPDFMKLVSVSRRVKQIGVANLHDDEKEIVKANRDLFEPMPAALPVFDYSRP